MSRRRYRKPYEGPQSEHNAPAQSAPFVFSRPVVVDLTKMEIPDLKIFASLSTLKDDAAAFAALPGIIDMLDRVVIGGTAGRPTTELRPLIAEVIRQMSAAGNPKN